MTQHPIPSTARAAEWRPGLDASEASSARHSEVFAASREGTGAARLRWQARAAPSSPPRWNGQAPGKPAWRAELFRTRSHPPGEWILGEDGGGLVATVGACASILRPFDGLRTQDERSSARADVFPCPAQAELVEAHAHA